MSGPGNPQVSIESAYSPVATEVITDSFRRMGVINENEIPTAGMFQSGMSQLNSMMKELEATGIHVWTEEEALLFLQAQQPRYLLGKGSTDHCCDAYAFAMGQLSQNAGAGDTAVTLLLGTIEQPAGPIPFAEGMQYGVTLDTGYNFWTTIETVAYSDVSVSITFKDALPSSASAQSFSFGYMTNIVRPLRVPAARRLAYQGLILTPLTNMMSRREYMDLPQPYSVGQVTQAYYNPSRNVGQLYCWNNPLNATQGLRFTWYRPLFNFTDPDDSADLPDEWGNALKWNLAKELLPTYSVPPQRAALIQAEAAAKLELVLGWDREDTPIYFGRGYDTTSRAR